MRVGQDTLKGVTNLYSQECELCPQIDGETWNPRAVARKAEMSVQKILSSFLLIYRLAFTIGNPPDGLWEATA